ncbi:hypothetical protein [Pseudonocardia humida]|uniref:Monooxygenase n=1 Tax=Pseudonocardia humida TaxID=2800819 RepID=A0ABT1AAB1_9PSEU|nr:hypothetical protein [Pseudonocardia humida]MCO1659970.1 hypothetical protein [Pseudonocardia humida]
MFAQTWIRYRGSPVVSGRAARRGPRPGDRVPIGRGGGLRHRALLLDGTDEQQRAVESVVGRYGVAIPVQRLARGRGAAWLLVLRPDGHLGYAGPADDLTALAAHLDRCHPPRSASRTTSGDQPGR